MAPKRRRRASARKGAKKGGSMGGISIGGGVHMCFHVWFGNNVDWQDDRIMKRVENMMYTFVIKYAVVKV